MTWVTRVAGSFLAASSLVACGGRDSGGAAQAGTNAQGGSSAQTGGQSSGASGSASAGTTANEADICSASCSKQASCNPSTVESTCLTNCNATDNVFSGSCATKQLAEFACLIDLTCDEIKSYLNDKLASPMCGATYQDFATACTLNQGVPPKECQDFCAKSAACNPSSKQPAGCAQSCNEVLTGFQIAGGASCGSAMQQAFGCLASLDCPTLLPALSGGATPAACSQYDTQLAAACQ